MTLVLDAGAFVSVERGNRELASRMRRDWLAGVLPVTHGGIVGQVWRGGGRQVGLTRVLAMTDVAPLDEPLGRRAGTLLAMAGTSDVLDAALVLLAASGDIVITSDPDDVRHLVAAADLHVEIVPV